MLTEDEIKELKFEDGLKKLEELVNQLDDGSLSLEESISYYEIGVKLKSHCEKLLKTAELKILKVSDKEKIVTEELQVGDNEQSL
ncbi:MAG: exodeoxyribonuclease VII small subunit [Rhodobacteraceae bacterium]|jgi:exodeoxyribonuclease VII small subunit|nr:exodeoxyribonuclease VII small subunit [Paracoccaceae bacterium]|tara:strand:- start:208 stop:462 length:255 start_codon:yes stop_codon:yes gene_type:complete